MILQSLTPPVETWNTKAFCTWEVCRGEWVFDFIHVGLKLVYFELKTQDIGQNPGKSLLYDLAVYDTTPHTLAVVGMPSILALCSASFFAILSLSSSVLSGILDLKGKGRKG